MNIKNLGYIEPTEDQLHTEATDLLRGSEHDDAIHIDLAVDMLREKHKDMWLIDYYKRNGGMEIGVCFSKNIGIVLNSTAFSYENSFDSQWNIYQSMPVVELYGRQIYKSSVIRKLKTQDEVDAYLQALDDSGVEYVELEPSAITVLKQLQKNYEYGNRPTE
jgi:hypothetical protein